MDGSEPHRSKKAKRGAHLASYVLKRAKQFSEYLYTDGGVLLFAVSFVYTV